MRYLTMWIVTLLLIVGCTKDSVEPVLYDVNGTWLFVGQLAYTNTICADTLTMQLVQGNSSLSGKSDDWHFSCKGEHGDGIHLSVVGVIKVDSLRLRWKTDSTSTTCFSCWVFTMVGRVIDSTMTGSYTDHLGGYGTWKARLSSR